MTREASGCDPVLTGWSSGHSTRAQAAGAACEPAASAGGLTIDSGEVVHRGRIVCAEAGTLVLGVVSPRPHHPALVDRDSPSRNRGGVMRR